MGKNEEKVKTHTTFLELVRGVSTPLLGFCAVGWGGELQERESEWGPEIIQALNPTLHP